MTLPLLATFPLDKSPFYSRISTQIQTPAKNYYAIAFNPGYPLQASELNEVQELFFMNNTLSNRFNSIWSVNKPTYIPYWNGMIPLDPTYISLTNVTNVTNTSGNWTGIITISNGWYLWNNPNSNLGFWIYLDENVTGTFTIPFGDTSYIGFKVLDQVISCCSSSTCSETQDEDIRDNSSGFPGGYLTCGASRLKATINPVIDIREIIPTGAESEDGSFWSLLFRITTTDNELTAEYTDDTSVFTSVQTTYLDTN
jgi:hypothetical protein